MPVTDPEEKPSWADQMEEGEDLSTPQLPPSTEVHEGDLKIVTEFKRSDDGKLIKYVRTYRVETRRVSKTIAKRKLWRKFGDAKNDGPGPNPSNTTTTDDVFLVLISSKEDNGQQQEDDPLKKLQGQQRIVQCRICKGDHWTTKCPYKDQLEVIQQQLKEEESKEAESDATADKAAKPATTGKYVAPGLRDGANRTGESMPRSQRDETATVRVTNLSEDTRETDLQELFRPFGPISRIFLAKDKYTNQSKGFAFINFVHREDAARAIESVCGFGYDHLILHVEWAKPSANT